MNPEVATDFLTPEIVASHFHLREGDVVADFGAGSGYFLPELSRRVGRSGKVYACEIQKNLVEAVSELARSKGLTNVHPLWADLEEVRGVKIKDEGADVGLLINTFFQLEDKDSAVQELRRIVRTGGKLIVIDWTDSFNGMGPSAEHIVTCEQITSYLESKEFILEQTFPAGSHHYGVVFRKV